MQTLRVYNSRIPRINNAKFSGYYFYVNTNISGDFQICISVPLKHVHVTYFFHELLIFFWLKPQRQIWGILPRISFGGIWFTRKFFAWYGKYSSSWNTCFAKRNKTPILSLNEVGEKPRATIILGNFVNKSEPNSHWLEFFRKCFSLVKIQSMFLWHILFMNLWSSYN